MRERDNDAQLTRNLQIWREALCEIGIKKTRKDQSTPICGLINSMILTAVMVIVRGLYV